jgi:ureidoacrylate peracid hydrolase
MHEFEMPQAYVERVTARQGRAHTCETFEPGSTALVVVDMQYFFMADGQLGCSPMAREIVPNVNRLAQAVRAAGGIVIWVRNLLTPDSLGSWTTYHERFVPDHGAQRLDALTPGSFGHQFWPTLDIGPQDRIVTKRRYSAFIQGSSDIENVLGDNGVRTVIVAGVATNCCCESTARDAMMRSFRTLMVSDGCATASDAEHAAALTSFYLHFGDVQSTDEVVARLHAAGRRNAG